MLVILTKNFNVSKELLKRRLKAEGMYIGTTQREKSRTDFAIHRPESTAAIVSWSR